MRPWGVKHRSARTYLNSLCLHLAIASLPRVLGRRTCKSRQIGLHFCARKWNKSMIQHQNWFTIVDSFGHLQPCIRARLLIMLKLLRRHYNFRFSSWRDPRRSWRTRREYSHHFLCALDTLSLAVWLGLRPLHLRLQVTTTVRHPRYVIKMTRHRQDYRLQGIRAWLIFFLSKR